MRKSITNSILLFSSFIYGITVSLFFVDENNYEVIEYENAEISTYKSLTNINGDKYTYGSDIAPTEIITISDVNGEPYLQFERDAINGYNPYSMYGREELDTMFENARNVKGSSMDPLAATTLIIETRALDHDLRLEVNEPSDGVMDYQWAKNTESLYPNTKRVVYVLDDSGINSEETWKEFWSDSFYLTSDNPAANIYWQYAGTSDKYSYAAFLTAVNSYPSYCGIKSVSNNFSKDYTLEDICALQLSTTFAHFAQETEFLTWPGEKGAWEVLPEGMTYAEAQYGSTCAFTGTSADWTAEAFPCATEPVTITDPNPNGFGTQTGLPMYKGRGSKQTTWNYNYGPASRTIYGYDDQETLLNNPSKIYEKKAIFTAGLEFGNTVRSPKPAMDWLPTGLWEPTQADIEAGNTNQFQTTINVINGGIECSGANNDHNGPDRRIASFFAFNQELNVPSSLSESFQSSKTTNGGTDYVDNCKGDGDFKGEFPLTWALGGWSGSASSGGQPTIETQDNSPFYVKFPGDYYRTLEAGNSQVPGFDGWATDWNKGKDAKYNPVGDSYMNDVIYSDSGWVDSYNITGKHYNPPGSQDKVKNALIITITIESVILFFGLSWYIISKISKNPDSTLAKKLDKLDFDWKNNSNTKKIKKNK